MSQSGPSESFQSHLELLDAESLMDNTANPVFKDTFLGEAIRDEVHQLVLFSESLLHNYHDLELKYGFSLKQC